MKIEVDSTHAVKGIKLLSKKVTDMTPLMSKLAGYLADVTEDSFDGEYDPTTGAGWAGLLPSTIKARRRKKHEGKILQDSGNLALSVVTEHGSSYAQIGTNKVYAAAHQFGIEDWPDRSGTLEARPFIGFSDEDADDMEKMISDFLSG